MASPVETWQHDGDIGAAAGSALSSAVVIAALLIGAGAWGAVIGLAFRVPMLIASSLLFGVGAVLVGMAQAFSHSAMLLSTFGTLTCLHGGYLIGLIAADALNGWRRDE